MRKRLIAIIHLPNNKSIQLDAAKSGQSMCYRFKAKCAELVAAGEMTEQDAEFQYQRLIETTLQSRAMEADIKSTHRQQAKDRAGLTQNPYQVLADMFNLDLAQVEQKSTSGFDPVKYAREYKRKKATKQKEQ